MKLFKGIYTWALNAKLYMGIYFVAVVFVTGIVVAITGGTSIELISLLQMLILSMIVAVLQCIMLDENTDYSKGIFFSRSLIWIVLSTLLTVAFSYLFNWFAGMPSWSHLLLAVFMLLGFASMLVGLKFEQDADTIRLNIGLKKFKDSSAK